MNILHKIAILHNINKNKNNVEYSFSKNKEEKSSPVVHRVTINQDGSFVSIQMHRDYYLDTFFDLRYYFPGQPERSILPCKQSFFDKLFISKMYGKMLNNYIAKKGMPNNKSR